MEVNSNNTDVVANNKRIAKNSILLYFRMILLMLVNLYTSRVILEVLGVEDYGTYNVVGGVITTLSFITGSLSGATSRFITFELGKNVLHNVEKIFRCSITIYYVFSIVIFLLAETVGLWFVTTYLVIPLGREFAVQVVYHCSVITFIMSVISIPYNALIIAHEHMNSFAYISIYEALSKLIILFLIPLIGGDSLICYAILLMSVQISVRLIYNIYCKKKFVECKTRFLWDRSLFFKMFSYSCWSMNGYLAIVGYTQGLNILLNIFFGPIINAARAISVQVQSALEQLFGNISMAVRPQIIKQYAQGNYDYMHSLMIRTGRLSFMMALVFAVPLLVYTEYILQFWLVNPPEHTTVFVRLMIIAGVSGSLKQHTVIAIHATGDIKKFQIVEGTFLLSVLPISYIMLKYYQATPESVIMCYVCIEILVEFIRVYLVYPKVHMPIKFFFTRILIRCVLVAIVSSIPAFIMYHYVAPSSFLYFLVSSIILVLIVLSLIYLLGLDSLERNTVKKIILNIFSLVGCKNT